ncbi:hypothetical protein [Archangium sp.]|uniref:hypothetical protein n=1 Tax=Archangium sp. TaxID=1872627 RepID=UPI002D69C857|nr:hypothetical protein [Archangium sp.]HYO58272.1 hypothetical protein [Archangium sp.]
MSTRLVDSRLTGAKQYPWLSVLVLAVLMAQSACITTAPIGAHAGHFGYDNTVSAACRQNSVNCAAAAGKDIETVREVGTAVASTAATLQVLFEQAKGSIEEKLEKCANKARSDVLIRHRREFKADTPDADECRQMTQNKNGRKMSWAQRLGEEMHEVARECVDQELSALRKGRYSLEQRYRIINLETGEKKLVSAKEEDALVNSGNAGELTGTLKPDVVIHEGDPLNAQAAYDFKFPCVNTDRAPDWGRYPKEHPFGNETQKSVYQKYIAPFVARILPRLGVVP